MGLNANGALVWAGSVGGVSPPITCPGSLATKLSRRDSRHGTAFAIQCGARLLVFVGLDSPTRIILYSDFFSGNIIYLGGGKCRDKLIAYTSVLDAVIGK